MGGPKETWLKCWLPKVFITMLQSLLMKTNFQPPFRNHSILVFNHQLNYQNPTFLAAHCDIWGPQFFEVSLKANNPKKICTLSDLKIFFCFSLLSYPVQYYAANL